MNSTDRNLSFFAAFAVSFSFLLTSCETTGEMRMGGVASWAAQGFRLYHEPEKQQPDPAIMHHKQSKGLITFKRAFTEEEAE